MKVDKSVRVEDSAWRMAKVESARRGIYIGELISAMIQWSLSGHTMTCPECERTFELYPPDYIQLGAGEEIYETTSRN